MAENLTKHRAVLSVGSYATARAQETDSGIIIYFHQKLQEPKGSGITSSKCWKKKLSTQ